VFEFARTTGWPLLVEATSNLRHGDGPDPEALVFDAFDLVTRALSSGRAESACEALKPDIVVQLGNPPTSASWLAFTEDVPRAVLANSGFPDPTNRAEVVVRGDLELTLPLAARRLPHPDPTFRQRVDAANRLAWQTVRTMLGTPDVDLSKAPGNEVFAHEGHATAALGRQLRPGDLLFVGNSLPVRLLDTFLEHESRGIRVLSQRGANGVDGLIAGAAGAALGHPGHTLLLLGDISFLHDVGSLALLRELAPRLTVVVFNNRGGRLFEQLPVAAGRDGEALRAWLTPHAHDLAAIASAFGLRNYRVGATRDLERALELSRAAEGPVVVEATIEPSGTSALYEKLTRRLETALSAELWWDG
jgi:2-succinyl-5-enolpyruvyl-6-hydroxy-3-cyclohexene-1-carboxylate synthase